MQEIGKTALQALVSISVLYILARIMGKKLISQLTFFDYVSGITIGSVAASFAIDPKVSYAKGVTALLVFALFPVILSLISLKSYRGRRLLDGKPEILIHNGAVIESNLEKTKMNVNDLLEECRQKDIFNIADVEFAVLETSGKVSILPKAPKRPLTPADMNVSAPYEGLCANLVIDGTVMSEHLGAMGKDRDWLDAELMKQNVGSVGDVLLAYSDAEGRLFVHRKNVPPPPSQLT